jgi:hypothetical protein
MRKTKLVTYAVALTLATAAMTGISTETAHAEEAVQAVATDTDAAETTEAPAAEETTEAVAEDVAAEEVTVADGGNEYYNININGGNWDGTHYTVGGNVIINAFFCDGTYTYYLQADGTPMKDRLTYHPDGYHIIYFDANGHEVFSDFAHVTKSIAGDAVDDLCFFDVYGYMYVNKLTYDKAGQNLYYINECGVIQRGNRWFQFPDRIENIDGEDLYTGNAYGFGTENGALLTNTMTYNKNGQQVYLQGNGMTAMGLTNLGGTWYMFDVNDGHFVQSYSSKPQTYTYTYYRDGYTDIYVYDKNDNVLTNDEYRTDGTHQYHYEASYDAAGKLKSDSNSRVHEDGTSYSSKYTYNAKGTILSGESNSTYYEDGKLINEKSEINTLTYASGYPSYSKSIRYKNGVLSNVYEFYYADTTNGDYRGNVTGEKDSYYIDGVLYSTVEYAYDSAERGISSTTKYYDANGNVIDSYVYNYNN